MAPDVYCCIHDSTLLALILSKNSSSSHRPHFINIHLPFTLHCCSKCPHSLDFSDYNFVRISYLSQDVHMPRTSRPLLRVHPNDA
jgi:hypothetical protein